MNICCAFCGLAPLDGEPCCNGAFKVETMRRTDRQLTAARAELRALRDAELIVKALQFNRAALSHGSTGVYGVAEPGGLVFTLDMPLTDEARRALGGSVP